MDPQIPMLFLLGCIMLIVATLLRKMLWMQKIKNNVHAVLSAMNSGPNGSEAGEPDLRGGNKSGPFRLEKG